jgi:hypothetical protein
MAIKSGLAHCRHHDQHFEWCYDFDERVMNIKEYKPMAEQPRRLKLFFLFPEDRLPPALVTAREALDTAREALDTAWEALYTARKAYVTAREALDTAWEAYVTAREAYDTAWTAYDTAQKAYDTAWKESMPELMKLHDELCPDCTWDEDRQTIF